MEEYGLQPNKKIKIDTTNIYPMFNSYGFENPRLVLIENNKIKYDTIYNPSEIMNIMSRLLEYYGWEAE
ncbi:MAG: hypothetical protein Kow0068_02650 [Marinilabiliales bacterium]